MDWLRVRCEIIYWKPSGRCSIVESVLKLVVLHLPQDIGVSAWQVWLQILLDVMFNSERLAKIDHAMRVCSPIGQLGNREIVRAADLVKIHETMSFPDNLQAGFAIDRRSQAHPGVDAGFTESPKRCEAITR